jgi:hypothetical protein
MALKKVKRYPEPEGLRFVDYNFHVVHKTPEDGLQLQDSVPIAIVMNACAFLVGAHIAVEEAESRDDPNPPTFEDAYAGTVLGIIETIEESYEILRVV